MRVLGSRVRRRIRARYGLWVLHEVRTKVRLGAGVPALRRFEDREVARIRDLAGNRPLVNVAVVVPTYKRHDRLTAAVESALAQTMANIDVVVVDDGGGLPSLPQDPRLFAVSLSRNCGVLGIVRNVGIRLTNSEYVAFLDDDNTWDSAHLELGLRQLDHGAHIVYTQVTRSHPDGRVLDVLSTQFDRKLLADHAFIDANSLIVKRSDGVRFSRIPRIRTTLPKEDWEFVYRLSRSMNVVHAPVPTVNYLVNPDSYFTRWRTDEQ